jgi:folate-binding protein YgfZ
MSAFTSIRVTGSDARVFLQGQLTCDMDTLTGDRPLLAACNSAQGRVQAVLTVAQLADAVELRVVTAMAERTLQRLRKYVLRSKVQLEVATELSVAEFPGGQAIDANNPFLAQLQAGIPHVFPETHEAFVAQMLNLDTLGGISFEKGCYTGQEIIARAHFRGAVKRRMFRFAAPCSPPIPGTRLLVDGDPAGDVVYAAQTDQGCELLAVVSLAHAESTLNLDAAVPLTKLSLPYSPTSDSVSLHEGEKEHDGSQ